MKRNILIALIGIFAIAAVATFAEARPGKRQNMGMMHEKMMSALDLTDAQKDKLKALHSTHKKEMVKLQAAAKLAQIELGDVLHQDTPKSADVKAKIAAVNTARGKVMEQRILNRLEAKKVFTPEQLKKMEELKMQHGKRMGEGRRGEGRHRGFRGQRGPFPGKMMPGDFEMEAEEAPATNM